MWVDVERHRVPFVCFTVDRAFSETDCELLEGLFEGGDPWQRRDGAFYRCFLRDVTRELAPEFRATVVARMREITSMPLAARVGVTAQRMVPGDRIGIHSDRPLVGFEVARLVVQMNAGWRSEDGGVLRLYDGDQSRPVRSVEPRYNRAFGFLLHEDSHHSVDEVTRERRSVVFNVWHVGNTPELAEAVAELFSEAHFSDLPASVNAVASRAEAELGEDVTLRAGFAAWVLHGWGVPESMLVLGYRFSVGWEKRAIPVVRLADWLARLHLEPFDSELWCSVRDGVMGGEAVPDQALALLRLCFPASEP